MKYIQTFSQKLKTIPLGLSIVFIVGLSALSASSVYAQTPLSIHAVIDIANPVQPKVTSVSYEWSFPPKSSTIVEGSYYEITLFDPNNVSLFSTRYPKRFVDFSEGAPEVETVGDVATLDLMLPYEKNATTITITDNSGAKLLSIPLEDYKPTIPPSPPPAFDLGVSPTTKASLSPMNQHDPKMIGIVIGIGVIVICGGVLLLKRRPIS